MSTELRIEIRRHDAGGWYAEIVIGDQTTIIRDPDPVAVTEKALTFVESQGTIAGLSLIDGSGLSERII